MAADGFPALVRIGELSRRTGVRPETIRAWERRYGLISPARSEGGFRLYSAEHERRIQAMRSLIAGGVAPAEAARQLRSVPAEAAPEPAAGAPGDEAQRLAAALEAYDEQGANAVLDRALGMFSIEVFAGKVVLPAMEKIGQRWTRGEVTVAQEHFASSLVRGRLLGLARGWGAGAGPMAVLACPPGEQHDLGLICFGLALRNRGWRITYLGQDTPIDTLADAARRLEPAAVVIAGALPEHLDSAAREIGRMAGRAPVWIAGAGAGEAVAQRTGALLLAGDPAEAAARLAAVAS